MTTQKRSERPPRMPARPSPTPFAPDRPRAGWSPAPGAAGSTVSEALGAGRQRVQPDDGVRVRKSVREREMVVDPPLSKDDVRVERVQVNRPVDGPVDVRYEGDTMIIPVLEEVLVVQKRLVLKEEIRVTRRRTETRAPQRVRLRSEHAVVERLAADGVATTADESAAASMRRVPAPPLPDVPPAGPAAAGAVDADSLIERKRRQTEMRRGRLAKTLLPY